MQIGTLDQGANYLICGDFNSRSSSDSSFYDFISFKNNENFDCFDPLLQSGTWHNNDNFSHIHTQSTHEQSTGYFASGGLDDRFDIIFGSKSILMPPEYSYIENSYHAFGNDSKHFNKSINNPRNEVVSDSIAEALYEASDHLPVIIKIGISPKNNSSILITVYITDTGTKYHNWGCRYLNESAHAISLEEAIRRGYKPCSVCNAPESEVTESEYSKYPNDFYLCQNYPNPFNTSTNVRILSRATIIPHKNGNKSTTIPHSGP